VDHSGAIESGSTIHKIDSIGKRKRFFEYMVAEPRKADTLLLLLPVSTQFACIVLLVVNRSSKEAVPVKLFSFQGMPI